MKRLFFFIVLVLVLVGMSFIVVDKYIVFAPSVVDAEVDNKQPELELEEIIILPPKPTEFEILAVGDVMFHMPQVNGAKLSGGGFDFSPSFKYVKPFIENADIALVNLETVIGGNEKGFNGFPRFNSPVETLDALKIAGFDIIVTANNHSLDGGKSGMINTINEIEKRELDYIGTSVDERRPFIIVEKEGLKIGMFSYTYGLNGLDSLLTSEDKSKMINITDIDMIQKDIDSLEDKDIDFKVVYIHWGNEYHRDPSSVQIELANQLAALGVDLILGSHPHVIQTSQTIVSELGSSYVIYSMGNFISNQSYHTMGVSYTEDGVMLQAKIIKDNETGITKLKEVNYLPTWIYRELKNNRYAHYIIPIEKALNGEIDIEFPPSTVQRLKKSLKDTLNTLNK
jgi:poly-gamma-glutamate capsule biosynthesis protein CapA/YwtB (metallophosphatase superfamily)